MSIFTRSARLLSVIAAAATIGQAQSIEQRVMRVKDGTVRMSFASRPDVCGNGRGSITTRNGSRTVTGNGSYTSSRSKRDEWEDECEAGPVRVAIDLAGGHVIEIRAYVGGKWRAPGDAVDLGTVPVKDAVDFLLDKAARADGKAAGEAIFPATIADGAEVWPRLLAIAKDESRARNVRTQAVFWVSQAAGEKATEGLAELVGAATEDRDVREQAVFALSQRPKDEGIPALLKVARTSKDPEIRKKAIFWLGQSRDPRAIEYFEAILTKR